MCRKSCENQIEFVMSLWERATLNTMFLLRCWLVYTTIIIITARSRWWWSKFILEWHRNYFFFYCYTLSSFDVIELDRDCWLMCVSVQGAQHTSDIFVISRSIVSAISRFSYLLYSFPSQWDESVKRRNKWNWHAMRFQLSYSLT